MDPYNINQKIVLSSFQVRKFNGSNYPELQSVILGPWPTKGDAEWFASTVPGVTMVEKCQPYLYGTITGLIEE